MTLSHVTSRVDRKAHSALSNRELPNTVLDNSVSPNGVPSVQSANDVSEQIPARAIGGAADVRAMRDATDANVALGVLFDRFQQQFSSLPSPSDRSYSNKVARSPEVYVENPPFFKRNTLTALDIKVMAQPFSVSNDTEMPAISGVETLEAFYTKRFPEQPSEKISDLAEEGFAFYAMRQLAKKGRLLNGTIPDGKSNQIADTSDEVLALRKFAGDAVVSHPLAVQLKANGADYAAFYDQVLGNLKAAGGLADNKPCTVRVLHPSKSPSVEGYTINFFSQCFSEHLTNKLNEVAQTRQSQDPKAPQVDFVNGGHITTLCRTSRAEATPIGRLGQLGYFSAQSVKPDEFIIIADDHAQSGDAWMTALLAGKEGGAQTVGLAAFSIHPFSQDGLFEASIQEKAVAKLKQNDPDGLVLAALDDIGITPSTITNFEALILLAVFTAPDDAVGREAYKSVVNQLSGDAKILTSAFDSLDPVLKEPVPTPQAFVSLLAQEIAQNRKVVEDVDAKPAAS